MLEASLEGCNKQVGNVRDVINQNSEMTAVGHFSILWYFFFFVNFCIIDGRLNI